MSLSDVIDRRYRLLPADLAGKARQVIVRGVTVEGVEYVTPLIHFEGVGRPLALDARQRIEMSRIARSTILADWVGASLVLQPVRDHGQDRIRLYALEEAGRRVTASSAADGFALTPRSGSGWRVLVRILTVLLIVALLLATVWFVESGANFDALLDVLEP